MFIEFVLDVNASRSKLLIKFVSDVVPSVFLFELQKLCDAVPSFPTSEAIKVIEQELG
jgi:predicted unusual protein kinase regulating ubiquinone biosynthesis (AarF/ABC1/UbiB family)